MAPSCRSCRRASPRPPRHPAGGASGGAYSGAVTDISSPPLPSATPSATPAQSTPGYDVAEIRSRYPALADGWACLDGAAGTQVPRSVIKAESAAYAGGLGNHGGAFAASKRSDALTAAARAAVADLVGAPS